MTPYYEDESQQHSTDRRRRSMSEHCDGDPIECNHESALGEAEERLRRVLTVCDELDERYLTGDGKPGPLTDERQIGKCAGYSLAAHLIRRAIAGDS